MAVKRPSVTQRYDTEGARTELSCQGRSELGDRLLLLVR